MPALIVKCVNSHDRCYGGDGKPCPYCEPIIPLRYVDGKFAPLSVLKNFKNFFVHKSKIWFCELD